MTHQKRLSAPKHYPIERKQKKYVSNIKGSRDSATAIPAGLLLRDVLEYAETEKEAKKIIRDGQVLRNGDRLGDVQEGVGVLDLIEIPETEEKFRAVKKQDRLEFVPVESDNHVAKIVDKTSQEDRNVYRLHNGENYSTKDEFETGSTLVLNDGAEEVALEEDSKALVIKGRHAGEEVTVHKLNRRGMNPDTAVVSEGENQYETQLSNLVAVTGIQVM
ncbi:hypothetical protein GLT92_01415 [Nanohaloarchaea archaeon]|nr:hypothetical protein [Candidatus Nanohaloarchaea archaeon]